MNFDPFSYAKDVKQTQLGKLYCLFKECLMIFYKDGEKVARAFFPYLADEENLEKHGKSLSLKRFIGESLVAYRARVSAGRDYIRWLGTRKAMREYLDALVGVQRYEVLEAPEHAFTVGESVLGEGERLFDGKGVFVLVDNSVRKEDRQAIEGYLDENLPPDVVIGVRGNFNG